MQVFATRSADCTLGMWRHRVPVTVLAIGVLVAAVFVLYWPAIAAGFVFDDEVLVTRNPSIEASDALNRIWLTAKNYEYLPLTYTSFLIERRLWGDWGGGYHLVSLILHAGNVLLVWRVLRQLKIPGAWLAALLFAIHPVAASSVAWISEQKNLWGLLFWLTSLTCWLQFRVVGRYRWYALSLLAFLMALLGKTSIVLGPAVILMCIWWQTGRIRPKDALLTIPFFLLSLAAGWATIWFQWNRGIAGEPIPIGDYFERFEAAGYALWFYVAKDLVPVHLSLIYPQWNVSQLVVWPSLAALAIAVVSWWFRKSWGRMALFAGGCYVAMLLPILGFIEMSFMKFSLVADHFQYSALPVAMALVAALGVWAVRNDRARVIVAGSVAIFLGALTWQQAGFYRDDETLWTETLRLNRDSWAAHNNLGKALAERKDLKDAIRHFSEAVRLKPDDSNLHYMLGTALMQSGDFDRAAFEFAETLKRNPQDYRSHSNLAHVLNEMGQFKPALEHGEAAAALAPDAAETHDPLGISLAALGETDRAIVQFQTAIRLDPRDATAHLGWAITLMHLDRPVEAAEQARAALAIDPDFPEAHFNLGNAFAAQSMRQEAAREYREAIRLRPEFPEAWANLRVVTGGRPE